MSKSGEKRFCVTLLALYLAIGFATASVAGAYFSYTEVPKAEAVGTTTAVLGADSLILWILASLGITVTNANSLRKIRENFFYDVMSDSVLQGLTGATEEQRVVIQKQVEMAMALEAGGVIALGKFTELKAAFKAWLARRCGSNKYSSVHRIDLDGIVQSIDPTCSQSFSSYGACFAAQEIVGNYRYIFFAYSSATYPIGKSEAVTYSEGIYEHWRITGSGLTPGGFIAIRFYRSNAVSDWKYVGFGVREGVSDAVLNDAFDVVTIVPIFSDYDDILAYDEGIGAIGNIYGTGEAVAVADEVPVLTQEQMDDYYDKIAAAIEAGNANDLTADEVNSAVTGAIGEEVQSIQQSSEETANNTAATVGWLQKIYEMLKNVYETMMGAAILTVIRGVKDTLDTINETAAGIRTGTDALVQEGGDELSNAITAVYTGVIGLPQQIAGALVGQHVIVDSMPDVVVPAPDVTDEEDDLVVTPVIDTDLTGVLSGLGSIEGTIEDGFAGVQEGTEAIAGTIEGVYTIEPDRINAVVDDRVETAKFVDLKPKTSLFQINRSFSKDYPVLKMKTPGIVKKAGYQNEEIILFNGKDYATYFVWVRNLLTAFFIVAYAYMCLKKFKVRFTM